MKVLFTATVDSHIEYFHLPYLKYFHDLGYEVHVATGGDHEILYCDKKFIVPFERSPYKLNNIKAISKLKKIIDQEQYDLIHTHTPMGSVITRIAARKARKRGTKVFYTAHGFHFYQGAPMLNWFLFYPIEKILSNITDVLITINQEDYLLASKKFKKPKVKYVPGVGLNEEKFKTRLKENEKQQLKSSLNLKEDDFVMIYVAELSNRKNQKWLINTLQETLKKHPDIHLLLPGKDSLNGYLQEQTKQLNLEHQIHFLGVRSDISNLLDISDLCVSSSKQEGLPVNLMEAMYKQIPIVATDCRGNHDLVVNNENGYLVKSETEFVEKSLLIYEKKVDLENMKQKSGQLIREYLLTQIMSQMEKIYEQR